MTTKFSGLTRKITKTTQKSMWITLWKLGISLKKVKNKFIFAKKCRETKMITKKLYTKKILNWSIVLCKVNSGDQKQTIPKYNFELGKKHAIMNITRNL